MIPEKTSLLQIQSNESKIESIANQIDQTVGGDDNAVAPTRTEGK